VSDKLLDISRVVTSSKFNTAISRVAAGMAGAGMSGNADMAGSMESDSMVSDASALDSSSAAAGSSGSSSASSSAAAGSAASSAAEVAAAKDEVESLRAALSMVSDLAKQAHAATLNERQLHIQTVERMQAKLATANEERFVSY
jgi:hypothetical protein